MPEPLTLLEKTCGHFGFVKSHYPQESISCSQCGTSGVEIDKILVPILRKIHTEGAIPDLPHAELNAWIKKNLESRHGKR